MQIKPRLGFKNQARSLGPVSLDLYMYVIVLKGGSSLYYLKLAPPMINSNLTFFVSHFSMFVRNIEPIISIAKEGTFSFFFFLFSFFFFLFSFFFFLRLG
jgi:hypothetical protein